MSGPKTDSTGQIQPRRAAPANDLRGFLEKLRPEMAKAMPEHFNGQRMARVVLTALSTNPDLQRCTRESFAACVMQLSQLGLEPNTALGHAYLIPRENRKRGVMECTMIIGYQGYLELARRAGTQAYAHAVRDGDVFEFEYGLRQTLRHIPSPAPDREDRSITHVYAVAKSRLLGDDPVFVVLSKAQIEARRARSATVNSSYSPWKTDYEPMAQKTAIRALAKWMPKSIEMVRAEAIETSADKGQDLFSALDADVAESLETRGLLPSDAETIDAETGEVAQKPAGDA